MIKHSSNEEDLAMHDPLSRCSWCNLSDRDKQWLLFETESWSVFLADEQDYIGRCMLVCKRHCAALSDLTTQEWTDLKQAVDRIEVCLKTALHADLCNWSCLMNSFYKSDPPVPHLHLHVRPRCKQPVLLNGSAYPDAEFAHHYDPKKKSVLREEDRTALFKHLKAHLPL